MLNLSFVLVKLWAMGCSDEKTALPDEISIDAPQGTIDNPYPQEVNIESTDHGDYALVEVRGYLYGGMSDLWSHFRNPQIFINHRQVDEYSIEEVNSSAYDYLYQIHLTVYDIVTVEYDHEWHHRAVEGSTDSPIQVEIGWEKVDGSSFIGQQEGSINFFHVADDDEVIELQIIYQLAALQNQEENARDYMVDLYANLFAAMNGEPIPTYND